MKPTRILVVDNEDDQIRLMHIILTKFGYDVSTVSSAEAALKEINSENYQLILTDLIMPEMEGPELCERIKRIKPNTKVYAISGHVELYKNNLAQSGFDGIIKKPIHMNSLKEAIDSALSRAE
jgi:CheY-like chemotaxis protein